MKTINFFTLLLGVLITGAELDAQTASATATTKGDCTIPEKVSGTSGTAVTFMNNTLKMAGNLYLPTGMDKNKKYSAIVVVHPGGGVKEQTAGLYAQRLAESGFVALAFDASYEG